MGTTPQFQVQSEEALALAGRLNQSGQDMASMCDALIKSAEAAESLTHTLGQNTVVRNYLVELSGILKDVIPGVESVATQLKNAAESAIQMEELAASAALVK